MMATTPRLAAAIACLIARSDAFSPSPAGGAGTTSLRDLRSPAFVMIDDANVAAEDEGDSSSPFADFDYYAHWYPVNWAHNLVLNRPQKVTVFDVDYVVARISDTEVIAMVDECPHKAAALSEGRVTPSGNFQCAYHGWSFDGTTGECVEIPQVVRPDGTMPPKVPSRSRGKAVPAMIHQEMVWLFPGGGLERALLADPPPSVEEYDAKNWEISKTVRDMPVDWPIVISNICDADHGLFAHQAKAFDLYTASEEYPVEVREDFPNERRGWALHTMVEATEKLLKVNAGLRPTKKAKDSNKGPQNITATSVLYAPGLRHAKRVDANGETSYVGYYYVCPVGVGRSRFFGGGYTKKAPPQWLTNLFLHNFLDQDTYLLATQQKNILPREAAEVRELMASTKGTADELTGMAMTTRRKMFCYASPSEKAGMRIEQFWDATLLRSPNRIKRLLQLDAAGAFSETPPRSVVLDRERQFLDLSPEARDVVKNCESVIRKTKLASALVVLAKVLTMSWRRAKAYDSVLKPIAVTAVLGISSLASFLAGKLKREHYFKYTKDYQVKDMNKIPTVWMDK
ncbi:hypothetical protein ACHAW5_001359 [Stephanodiscus triporus]|uniref:Rieske domain-containing protein n=1 Tax=Stephanodiscus triporus TaxID=2934178 RepID=A0ABD3P4F3_9STRA